MMRHNLGHSNKHTCSREYSEREYSKVTNRKGGPFINFSFATVKEVPRLLGSPLLFDTLGVKNFLPIFNQTYHSVYNFHH